MNNLKKLNDPPISISGSFDTFYLTNPDKTPETPAACQARVFPSLYACSGYWLLCVMDNVPQPFPSTIPQSSRFRYLTSVL